MHDIDLENDIELKEALRLIHEAEQYQIEAAKTDVNAFIEYAGVDDDKRRLDGTPAPLTQYPLQIEMQRLMEEYSRLVIMSMPRSGKAVSLDTTLHGVSGPILMSDVKIGDKLFDRFGKVCTVTYISPIQFGREVYKIQLDDGTVIKADADHQWWVKQAGRTGLRIKTTQEMLNEGLRYSTKWKWRIPLVKPLEYPEQDLPIHPYVLGVWLGDGSSDSPMITYHEKDRAVVDRCIEIEGSACKPINKKGTRVYIRTISGSNYPTSLRSRLINLGVLNNKHIPDTYMRASIEQRRELLAGLVDTDGMASNKGGASVVQFFQSNEKLAYQVLQLVRSLGFKAYIKYRDRKPLENSPHNIKIKNIKPSWTISFTATEQVFYLKRKQDKLRKSWEKKPRTKSIISIEKIPSVPVRCISVDSPDQSYIIGDHCTVTHNTTQVVLRTVWVIGNNPDIRVVILSANQKQDGTAAKMAQQIKSYIDTNERVKKVFPHLHRGAKWEQTRFQVRRSSYRKDYTVQITAPPAYIQGSRADLFIFDDVYDGKSIRTEAERKKLEAWFYRIIDRVEPKGGRIIMLTNPWHPRDLAHNIEREAARDPNPLWYVKRYPLYYPNRYDANLDEVELVYPDYYNKEMIEVVKKTYPPLDFNRLFLCNAIDENESPFDVGKVFKSFRPPHHKEGGEGGDILRSVSLKDQAENDVRIVIGVDLAARRHAKADMTVLSVVAVWMKDGIYQLIYQEGGRWRSDQTAAKILDFDKRYRPTAIVVENNAAQDYIFQVVDLLIQNKRLEGEVVPYPPVEPFTTGRNKSDPVNGIESISAEINNDMWAFPAIDPENPNECHKDLVMLQDEITSYSRNAHTGDHLMSLWLAREGGRRLMYGEYEDVNHVSEYESPIDTEILLVS
jgi:hypothetical protein